MGHLAEASSSSITYESITHPAACQPTVPIPYVVIHLLAIVRRIATKQLLAHGKFFAPDPGPVADDKAQMPNGQDTVAIRACTQALCDKGICSPGLSDMGMYCRISLY
jgi:hypothetical protein